MNILVIILTALSIAILFYAIFKPKIGASLYLVYMFLAPYLYIGGLVIYARTIALFFLLLFILKFKNKLKRTDYKPFIPYIIYLTLQFILLFTSSIFTTSLNAWFTSCSHLFFILFLYGCMKMSPQNVQLFSKILNECPHVSKLAKFKPPRCPIGVYWNTLCLIRDVWTIKTYMI